MDSLTAISLSGRKALCTLLLFALAALPVFSLQWRFGSGSSTLLSQERYLNPAYHRSPDYRAAKPGRSIPLGLTAIPFDPARNPFLYATAPDRFRSSFDLLTFYHQLLYPSFWLLNPAESPKRVELYLTNEGFEVRDETGESLQITENRGPWNVSRPLTPLLPPPLFSAGLQAGAWSLESAIFAGGNGITYSPNSPLASYHDTDSLKPNTSYLLEGELSYSIGLQLSVIRSFSFTLSSLPGRWTAAPRLLGYYRTAFLNALYTVGTETDGSGNPTSGITSLELFSGYPGTGWGLGIRTDLGVLWQLERVSVGLSGLNLAGVELIRGSYGQDASLAAGNTEERLAAVPPAFMLTGGWSFSPGLHELHLSGSYGYSAGHLLQSGVYWSRSPYSGSLRLRWNGGTELLANAGYVIGSWRVGAELLFHPAPFTGEFSAEVGLRIGRKR